MNSRLKGSILYFFLITSLNAQTITFDDSKPDTLILKNSAYYELAINKSFGGFYYIKDKTTGENVSIGSPFGSMLWGIKLKDGTDIWSTSTQVKMSYEWSSNTNTLTLRYSSSSNGVKNIIVVVTIRAVAESYFEMQMTVMNNSGQEYEMVRFPLGFLFEFNNEDYALIAFDYPGIRLNSNFFSKRLSFSNSYPGWLNSDFVSLKIKNSLISMFTLRDGLPVQFTKIGLMNYFMANMYSENTYSFQHEYPVWIKDGTLWSSPISRFNLSQSVKLALKEFRKSNNLSSFPSLDAKLGFLYNSFIKSPYYYLNFGETTNFTFNQIPQLTGRIPNPALMMITCFWSDNFFRFHPDILPPNPQRGTPDEFAQMYRAIHNQGHLIMTFMNPTWWHEESPTLRNLSSSLTINDVVGKTKNGNPMRQSWINGNNLEWGYYVSPSHPVVKQKLYNLMNEFKINYPSDLIWEDGVGACSSDYDFNSSEPNPVSFDEEWLDHTRRSKDNMLVIERGYDRTAETAIGYMGTGLRAAHVDGWSYNKEFGIDNWNFFPVSPFLYNDKIVHYQYWWIWTDNKEALSWSLLYGCMLNYSDWDKTLEKTKIPWLDVIAAFQQSVVSRIAGKLMTDYKEITDKINQSTFDDITVLSNGNSTSYSTGKYLLASDGTLVTSSNGDLVAGIFNRFNNENLTPGDHYLIINTNTDCITIRQPMGSDTPLAIDRPLTWTDISKINIYAICKKSNYKVSNTVEQNVIRFNWQNVVSSQRDTVLYYKITYGEVTSVNVEENSLPTEFKLYQNYPNPFNPKTIIKFDMPIKSFTKLIIYDILGREVETIENQELAAGYHNIEFNASNLSSGIYFYKIQSGGFTEVKKMILMK